MNDEFKIEVDTGNGGYGFIDTIPELLADVKREYGNDEVKKVNEWLKIAKENDEYISNDGRMHIYHIGKQINDSSKQ